jgi:uncharacterized protein
MGVIRAVFENGIFRPLDPVDLPDKAEVLVEAVTGRPRSRDAVLAAVRAELPRLREQYRVSRLILFGSAARDEMTAESDVDFAVELVGEQRLLDVIDLSGDLTYLLGRPADVLPLDRLKPNVREALEIEGIVLTT